MSFETELDQAFTILLGKAQNTITQTDPSTSTPPVVPTDTTGISSYSAVFMFGGGGSALTTSADPILIEVPDAGELVWVHLYAGNAARTPVAVTATLALDLTSYSTFGSSSALYGSGTAPRLQADSHANVNLSNWTTHLDAGDTLISSITAFTGTATWLAMILRVRRDSSG